MAHHRGAHAWQELLVSILIAARSSTCSRGAASAVQGGTPNERDMTEQPPPAASPPPASPPAAPPPPASPPAAPPPPSPPPAAQSSSGPPAPAPRLTVLTARQAWQDGAEAEKDRLCDAWIRQAEEIAEAEKNGEDRTYVACARIAGLIAAVDAALAPGGLDAALAGPDFTRRFISPALEVVGDWASIALWAAKNCGPAEAQVGRAKAALSTAVATMRGLADKAALAPSIGRTAEDDEGYWGPLDAALRTAKTALEDLCPRMASVRNAATTCGQAKDYGAERCLLLADNGQIRALAMRTIGVTLHVHDLTVEPRALQDKVRGLGGALMEYLIREAAARNLRITLLPIGDLAKAIYTTMGFAPQASGDDWELTRPGQLKYLATHRVFAGSVIAAG